MRHGWKCCPHECSCTRQHSIGDLRFARTRSARRPGSDARAAALYATFASAILPCDGPVAGRVPPRRRRSGESSVGPRGAGADLRKPCGAASGSSSRLMEVARAQRCTKGTH